MDEEDIQQVKRNLSSISTNKLTTMVQNHDLDKYSRSELEAARQVLLERGGNRRHVSEVNNRTTDSKTNIGNIAKAQEDSGRKKLWSLPFSVLAFIIAYAVIRILQADFFAFRGTVAVVAIMTIGAAALEVIGVTPLIAYGSTLLLLWDPTRGGWHFTGLGMLVVPVVSGASYYLLCRLGTAWWVRKTAVRRFPEADHASVSPVSATSSHTDNPSTMLKKERGEKNTAAALAKRTHRMWKNHALDGFDGSYYRNVQLLSVEDLENAYSNDRAIQALVNQTTSLSGEYVIYKWSPVSDEAMYVLTNIAFYFWTNSNSQQFGSIALKDIRSCSIQSTRGSHESLSFTLRNGRTHVVESVQLASEVVKYIKKREDIVQFYAKHPSPSQWDVLKRDTENSCWVEFTQKAGCIESDEVILESLGDNKTIDKYPIHFLFTRQRLVVIQRVEPQTLQIVENILFDRIRVYKAKGILNIRITIQLDDGTKRKFDHVNETIPDRTVQELLMQNKAASSKEKKAH